MRHATTIEEFREQFPELGNLPLSALPKFLDDQAFSQVIFSNLHMIRYQISALDETIMELFAATGGFRLHEPTPEEERALARLLFPRVAPYIMEIVARLAECAAELDTVRDEMDWPQWGDADEEMIGQQATELTGQVIDRFHKEHPGAHGDVGNC